MRTVLLAAAAFLCWSGTAFAEDRAPDHPAAPAAPRIAVPAERPMLSQGDPGWKSLPLGSTTVGKAGCLAFAVMDVLESMGLTYASPYSFIAMLSQNGLLTPSGLLKWSLDKLFPVTATRLAIAGMAAFNEAVNRLSQGAGVVLEVITDRGTRHWVVASRIVGNDIEVRDPDGGRIGLLSSLYGIDSLRGLAAIARR